MVAQLQAHIEVPTDRLGSSGGEENKFSIL